MHAGHRGEETLILVPYHEEEAARAALKVAVLLAKRFESYVEGLLVLGEPMLTFVPGMIVPPDYLSAAVEEWRRFADRARREFAETTDANGLPMQELETPAKGLAAGWREMQGEEADRRPAWSAVRPDCRRSAGGVDVTALARDS